MPKTTCQNCYNDYEWQWEDAFDKFGFQDGDGEVMTWKVEAVLRNSGYHVESHRWGFHNIVINSIKRDGDEMIPEHAELGYDNPRDYLPLSLIALLDKHLPSAGDEQ